MSHFLQDDWDRDACWRVAQLRAREQAFLARVSTLQAIRQRVRRLRSVSLWFGLALIVGVVVGIAACGWCR